MSDIELAELAAAYPECPDAIGFVEAVVCGVSSHGDRPWDLIVTRITTDPRGLVEQMKSLIASTGPQRVGPERVASILAEMGTTAFGRYIAGKVGAM